MKVNGRTFYILTDIFFVIFLFLRQLYMEIPTAISFIPLILFSFFALVSAFEKNLFSSAKMNTTLLMIVFFVFSGVLSFLLEGNPYILVAILYSFSLYNSDPKRRIKSLFKYSVIAFTLVSLLSISNIIPMNKEPIFSGRTFFSDYKLSLGFVTANYAFLFFNLLVFMYSYIKGKLKMKNIVIIAILSVFLFFITRSRTGFIVSIMFLILYNPVMALDRRSTNIVARLALLMMILGSFMIGLNVFGLAEKINPFLNGRPLMWNYYLTEASFSLFGTQYVDYIFLDNFYLYLFSFNGIITFVPFIISYYYLIKHTTYSKSILCIIIFINFYFIFENCFKVFLPFISIMIGYNMKHLYSVVNKEEHHENSVLV